MFSLFQHFVFSLSLLFFEKNIFFAFWGFILCFYFFLIFFLLFPFLLWWIEIRTCVGVKQSKIQKTMQEINFFFLPNQNVICKYDE